MLIWIILISRYLYIMARVLGLRLGLIKILFGSCWYGIRENSGC